MESDPSRDLQPEIAGLKAQLELQKEQTASLQLALEKLTAQVNSTSTRSCSESCRCGEKQELDSVQDTLDTMKSDAEAFLVKLFAQYRSEVETIQIWVATELSNQLGEMRLQLTAEKTKLGLEDTLLQLQRGAKKAQTRIAELETRAQQESAKNAANLEKLWAALGASASNSRSRLITQDDLELTTAKLITAHDELVESQDAIWDSMRILFSTQDRIRAQAADTEVELHSRLADLRRSLISELSPRVVIHEGVHHIVTPLHGFPDSPPVFNKVAPSSSRVGPDVTEVPRFPPERSTSRGHMLKPRSSNLNNEGVILKDIKRLTPRKMARTNELATTTTTTTSTTTSTVTTTPSNKIVTLQNDISRRMREDSSPQRKSPQHSPSKTNHPPQRKLSPLKDVHNNHNNNNNNNGGGNAVLNVQLDNRTRNNVNTNSFQESSSVTPRKLFMRDEDIDKFSPMVIHTPGNGVQDISPQARKEEVSRRNSTDEKEARLNKRKLTMDDVSNLSPATDMKHQTKPIKRQEASSDSEPDRWEHEVVLSEQFADVTEGSCTDEPDKEAPNWSQDTPKWPSLPGSTVTVSPPPLSIIKPSSSNSSPRFPSSSDLCGASFSAPTFPTRALTVPVSSQHSSPRIQRSLSSPTPAPSRLSVTKAPPSPLQTNLKQSSSTSTSFSTLSATPGSSPSEMTAVTTRSSRSPSPLRSLVPARHNATSNPPSSSSVVHEKSETTGGKESIYSASLRSSSCHGQSVRSSPLTFAKVQEQEKIVADEDELPLLPTVFVKHAVGFGKPKRTLVSFIRQNDGLGVIHWETAPVNGKKQKVRADKSRELAVEDITDILVGKKSKVLQRSSSRHAIAEHCFSLVSRNRTLDLEASTPETATLWINTLSRLRSNSQA